jgi:hypothetical protein
MSWKIRNKIEDWYHSKDSYPPPIEGIIGVSMKIPNPPLIGKFLVVIWKFWRKHWKSLIRIVITIWKTMIDTYMKKG